MFFQQTRDFNYCPDSDNRVACVNVQLEQCAQRINSLIADCFARRSVAFVVDSVHIDVIKRTQQLTRVCFVIS